MPGLSDPRDQQPNIRVAAFRPLSDAFFWLSW
jgi:hypothetical protein